MKDLSSNLIPVEPDTQEALARALKSGESAKVMLAGSDEVFIMTKAAKGNDFELTPVSKESSNSEMRRALENIKEKLK